MKRQAPGDVITVQRGCFAGFTGGVVEIGADGNELLVRLDILGRLTRVTISVADLEPEPPSPDQEPDLPPAVGAASFPSAN